MEQVVILLLFVVASIVSSVVQNRNKRRVEEEEKARREGRSAPAAERGPRPPFQQWPKTAKDWQEELRRLLEEAGSEKPVPPIVIPQHKPNPPARASRPPVIAMRPLARSTAKQAEVSEGDLALPTRLKDSDAAYARASDLHDRVQDRMREVVQATEAHRPVVAAKRAPASPWASRFHDARAIREAFVASVILSPPVALQAPDAIGGRPSI